MIKGQVVKAVGARVGNLVLGVVAFVPKRACKLTEIHLQAGTNGGKVAAVGLVQVAPHLRALFVHRRALQGLRRLTELKIESSPEALLGSDDVLQNKVCLVQIEAVAGHIVSTQ